MKLVKVKINMTTSEGRTHHDYPPEYNSEKIQVMSYGLGHCIGWIKDVDLEEFVPSVEGSGEIWELTRDEAIVDLDIWMPQSEKITDQTKVLSILAKQARGETLTPQELNALDPNNPESGITKTKSGAQIIDELLSRPELG